MCFDTSWEFLSHIYKDIIRNIQISNGIMQISNRHIHVLVRHIQVSIGHIQVSIGHILDSNRHINISHSTQVILNEHIYVSNSNFDIFNLFRNKLWLQSTHPVSNWTLKVSNSCFDTPSVFRCTHRLQLFFSVQIRVSVYFTISYVWMQFLGNYFSREIWR